MVDSLCHGLGDACRARISFALAADRPGESRPLTFNSTPPRRRGEGELRSVLEQTDSVSAAW
eukprot:COSAG04_NODE_20216_length_398_cov_0.702341_1_plen_61_part_10